jgi:hypothetical protein
MGEYVSDFGVVRYVGRGEGRDEKYDASAMPALGPTNGIEVVVDENGPLPNVGTGYGNGQAKIPAGSVVIADSFLFVEKKGSAAGISLSLVKADGSDPQVVLTETTPSADGAIINFSGVGIGVGYAEDRYLKVSGTTTGLKAKAVISFM